MENGEIVPGSFWLYAPNKPAPIVLGILFAVLLLAHTYLATTHRTWKYTYVLPLCCLDFTVGYALRAAGSFALSSIPVYLASTIFIFIAPPLLELQAYHVLSHLLYYVPYHAPIHPGRVTSTFLIISVLVEVLNAVGIAWVASPNADPDIQSTGRALQKASLVLQLGVVGCYYALAATFHMRCYKNSPVVERRIRTPMVVLYAGSALVLVRTVYRTVEYFGEASVASLADVGPILRYEWFFYVFECVPMVVNVAMWAVWHPGRYLPSDTRVQLSRDGESEVLGEEGWVDERNFWVTVLDPFGWGKKEKGSAGDGAGGKGPGLV